MKYIIGVDGGGTKSEAIAFDWEGGELARAYSGFGNILLNFEEAYKNIEIGLETCIKQVEAIHDKAQCMLIYLGLAGVEAEGLKAKLEGRLMGRFNLPIKVTNDADIALAALLRGRDGIITISGTGSISYGINNGKIERTGGWGHLLGDEGSGYYIAMQGFKDMTIEEDLRLPYSSITKAFMEKLGIKNISGIKNFIYSSSKGEIASFALIIAKLAQQGDERAEEILIQAGKALAYITYNLYKKLNFKEEAIIGIKGSILTKVLPVRKAFEEALKHNIKKVTIVENQCSPAEGAFYLAKELLECRELERR